MDDVTIQYHGSLSETAEEILRRRADSLALETLEEESANQLSLLLFRMGDEWYAVRVSDVREIYQEYQITPIPCVPEHIPGVVNIRGEILSVTDIAKLMRLGSVDMTGPVQPPAIVITNDECATAMIVDEIGDITDVPEDSVEPPVSIIDRAQADYVSGSVYVNGGLIGLLNTEKVLEPVGESGRH